LAETSHPYEDGGGAFLRYPSTLAPNCSPEEHSRRSRRS
jgi:hypothetical protein